MEDRWRRGNNNERAFYLDVYYYYCDYLPSWVVLVGSAKAGPPRGFELRQTGHGHVVAQGLVWEGRVALGTASRNQHNRLPGGLG